PEIYTMNADGTGVKRLTNNQAVEATPSFSKDGRWIAYSSSPGTDGGSSEIYVMDTDGGNQTRLTDNSVDDLNPAFSPDGSKIVFDSNSAGNRDLYVMNAEDGSQRTAVAQSEEPEYDPVFNATGTKIAFVSKAKYDDQLVIWVMDAPGYSTGWNYQSGTYQSRTYQISRGYAGGYVATNDVEPTFDRSGIDVAFASSSGENSIYSADVIYPSCYSSLWSVTRLTSSSGDRYPSYSPDGARIAFTRTTEGDSRIYAMESDGAHQVSLSSGPGDSQPTWGPQPDSDRDGLGDACDPTPAANDDAFSVDEDATLNVPARDGVLANDVNVNGFEVALVSGPNHAASFTLDKDGSFTYTPVANFNGPDTFKYKASNTKGDSDTATVSITVKPVNDAPNATNDTASTDEDTPLDVNVLANDKDVEGESLSISSFSNTSEHGGTVSKNDNGTLRYTPKENYNGPDSFTYKANDGTADSNTATVNITVNTVNDAPTISNITDQTILEDTNTGDLAFTVSNVDKPAGDLTLSGSSSDTTLVPNANVTFGGSGGSRTVKVSPAANRFGGPAKITVSVSDGDKIATSAFNLNVTPVNDAPSFRNGADQSVAEDAGPQSVSGWATNISAGAFETQTLTFSATNDNNSLFTDAGQPRIAPNGTLTYTPAASASGSATVSVKATDNGGTDNGGQNESAVQTFKITVTPVNDAPTVTVAAGGSCSSTSVN
ncbi:MAG: tandem-95 repeat protein, partial [Propionibacteriaceae bacterium]|nr:tandem-95 repeat protein [Propionibacteriaceae bacterium]